MPPSSGRSQHDRGHAGGSARMAIATYKPFVRVSWRLLRRSQVWGKWPISDTPQEPSMDQENSRHPGSGPGGGGPSLPGLGPGPGPPCPERFESGGFPNWGQPVVAILPAAPDRQETKGSAQVERLMKGPTDRTIVRRIPSAVVPEACLARCREDVRPDRVGGHDLDVDHHGQTQFAGQRDEWIRTDKAPGRTPPKLLGRTQGFPAPGGQHESAAAAAGKTLALGEMADQVEIEEIVFGSRRACEVPPEPGGCPLHELLTKVPRLGERHPLDELLQQPVQREGGVR